MKQEHRKRIKNRNRIRIRIRIKIRIRNRDRLLYTHTVKITKQRNKRNKGNVGQDTLSDTFERERRHGTNYAL